MKRSCWLILDLAQAIVYFWAKNLIHFPIPVRLFGWSRLLVDIFVCVFGAIMATRLESLLLWASFGIEAAQIEL